MKFQDVNIKQKIYHKCFTGKQAIEFLITEKFVTDTKQAMDLGNKLILQKYFICPYQADLGLNYDNTIYQFLSMVAYKLLNAYFSFCFNTVESRNHSLNKEIRNKQGLLGQLNKG